jgi:hypothetical protein
MLLLIIGVICGCIEMQNFGVSGRQVTIWNVTKEWDIRDKTEPMHLAAWSTMYRGALTNKTSFSCSTATDISGGGSDSDKSESYLLTAFSFILLSLALFFAWYPSRQERLATEVDDRTASIDQYTVYLNHFNEEAQLTEAGIIDWLDQIWSLDNDLDYGEGGLCDIVRVVLVYDLHAVYPDLVKCAEREDLITRLEMIQADMDAIYTGNRPSIFCCRHRDRAKSEAKKASDMIRRMQGESAGLKDKLMAKLDKVKTVGAYVTFETRESVDHAVEFLRPGWCRRQTPPPYQGYDCTLVRCLRADHPSDVYWENIGLAKHRKMRIVISFILGAAAIIAASLTEWFLQVNDWATDVSSLAPADKKTFLHQAESFIIGLLSFSPNGFFGSMSQGAVILVMNSVLCFVLQGLTCFELPRSSTLLEDALLRKGARATIINFMFALFFVHWVQDPTTMTSGEMFWYGEGGLGDELVYMFLVKAVCLPIFALVPIEDILSRLPSRLFTNVWTSKKTQAQLDELYLGPTFGVWDRAVEALSTFFFVAGHSAANANGPAVRSCVDFRSVLVGQVCITACGTQAALVRRSPCDTLFPASYRVACNLAFFGDISLSHAQLVFRWSVWLSARLPFRTYSRLGGNSRPEFGLCSWADGISTGDRYDNCHAGELTSEQVFALVALEYYDLRLLPLSGKVALSSEVLF